MTYRLLARLPLLTLTFAVAGCNQDPAVHRPTIVSAANPAARPADGSPMRMSNDGGPVAQANGVVISSSELIDVLYQTYGIRIVDALIERDLAKQELDHARAKMALTEPATAATMVVTPADIDAEWQLTFKEMFTDSKGEVSPDQYEPLFAQFLEKQHTTRLEFQIKIIEENAYLRKRSRPQMAGQVTDDIVHTAFEQVYGENRKIADLVVSNISKAQQAKVRIAAGVPFGAVVADTSEDERNRQMGGEWPPFGPKQPAVQPLIRDTAFAMKLGDVSDILNVHDEFHVIKLIGIYEPRAVKFDDVKDSVRASLEAEWLKSAISQYRQQIRAVAVQKLQLYDPTLNRQWESMKTERQPKTAAPGDVSKRMGNQYPVAPTTEPAGDVRASPPTTAPAGKQ